MTALVWDQVGERFFQTGLDRGVLYLADDVVVPWNGLASVEESFERERKSYYLDGVKYLEYQTLSDFAGKLTAFTYPDEFDEVVGIKDAIGGLMLHDQKSVPFGLSYRTLIGNDLDGIDHGYTIHIIWNVLAIPDSINFSSISEQSNPTSFGWSLSAIPEVVEGYRPTAHISFRSIDLDPDTLEELEELLYGTATEDPSLPSLEELIAFIELVQSYSLVDNEDGSWTAIGSNVAVADDEFTITDIDPVFSDADSFELETTD